MVRAVPDPAVLKLKFCDRQRRGITNFSEKKGLPVWNICLDFFEIFVGQVFGILSAGSSLLSRSTPAFNGLLAKCPLGSENWSLLPGWERGTFWRDPQQLKLETGWLNLETGNSRLEVVWGSLFCVFVCITCRGWKWPETRRRTNPLKVSAMHEEKIKSFESFDQRIGRLVKPRQQNLPKTRKQIEPF